MGDRGGCYARFPFGQAISFVLGVLELESIQRENEHVFSLREIVCLALFGGVPFAVWADAADNEYKLRLSPTMAVFYSVQPDGHVVREDVDVAVIANPNPSPPMERVSSRQVSRHQVESERPKTRAMLRSHKQRRHDDFAEFRCESYGFYYTRKGDCIVPARSYQIHRSPKWHRHVPGPMAAPANNAVQTATN